ncbi:DUF952 domain-containing protein [Micromonospora sp. NBC_00421]|uniref:DUF952 domain-containing protein n=1 Tax=Micromonospora sp. NBC_00421 TaxID=2975976 RepID=UPI002E21397A
MLIYKILLPAEWSQFDATGRFDGSPLDHSSGFVHCSSRAQVAATAVRFFAPEPALVVVALDTRRLGAALRWEDTPDGQSFPHVYSALPLDAVVAVHPVAGASSVDRALPQD